MISAFEVYLVLQLDSISNGLNFLTLLAGCAVIGLYVIGFFCKYEEYEDSDSYNVGVSLHQKVPKAGALFLSLFIVNALFPSTKTAAAMIMLPVITSKDVIEPIAGKAKEFYTLTKEALKSLDKDEVKK
jgi:hypothetical protein